MRKLKELILISTLITGWLGAGVVPTWAEEQKGPKFESETYYGGVRHQGAGTAGQWEMGLSAQGNHLYISAIERALSLNDQTLGLKVTLPPGPSPVWTFRWFSDPTVQHHAPLPGIAATEEGVFLAGMGKSDVVNRYGVWGHKAVLVKYALEGPTGTNPGGALWTVLMPKFFPDYNGNESFWDLVAVKEKGATFLYATGLAEAGENNVRAILAKFDSKGILIWWRALGSDASYSMSWGLRVAAVNGQIYVAGSVNPDLRYDYWNWRAHIKPVLWKIDPSGNVMWEKRDTRSIADRMASAVGGSGNSVYLVATLLAGKDGNSDILMMKYGENGDLLWSKQWGTLKEDIVHAVVGSGDRLYVVGDTQGWVGGDKDVFLLELDAANGDVLSVQYHGGKYRDRAFRVLTAGTDLYVLGESYSHSNFTRIEIMLLRYRLSQESPLLTVHIDIKPGSFPNSIQPESQGNIPVAILSSVGFNAPKLVDPNSLTFGRTGDEKSLQPGKVHPEDINGDGLLDLVCHFDTPKSGFQVGDLRGILKGKLLSGRLLMGVDSVRILEKKQIKEPPREIRKELPKEPPKKELRRQPPPVEKVQPVPPPRKQVPGLGSPSPKDLRRFQEDSGVAY